MPRILGVDPGSRITGYGVIELLRGRPVYVASGTIRAGDGLLPDRLRCIFARLTEVIAEYRPDELAIEQVFVHRNPSSALKLGQARGVAICAAAMQSLPVAEYSPREIKLAVVGGGGADKAQVGYMVKVLLSLSGRLQTDAADALAVAMCHGHRRDLEHRTRSAVQGGT